jgi:hypothetical protein
VKGKKGLKESNFRAKSGRIGEIILEFWGVPFRPS